MSVVGVLFCLVSFRWSFPTVPQASWKRMCLVYRPAGDVTCLYWSTRWVYVTMLSLAGSGSGSTKAMSVSDTVWSQLLTDYKSLGL